jgi:hypothetical protein
LYAALDVKTGQVQGMTAGRHTSHEFAAFLESLVSRTRWDREIHVVLDNSGQQAPPLHPRLLNSSQAFSLDLYRSNPPLPR